MREIIKQGKGDYIPISIAHVPHLVKKGVFAVDAALIQVTMPDKHGFVSLGVSADVTHSFIQQARTVIAELNPNMPRTCGDTYLSMDKIDKAVGGRAVTPTCRWIKSTRRSSWTNRF